MFGQKLGQGLPGSLSLGRVFCLAALDMCAVLENAPNLAPFWDLKTGRARVSVFVTNPARQQSNVKRLGSKLES